MKEVTKKTLTIKELTYTTTLKKYLKYDKLVIDVKKGVSFLWLAKNETMYYNIYRELINNNYMFYMQAGQKSYFIKRHLVAQLWQRKDLIQCGELFYTIEDSLPEKKNRLAPNRLVIIFSSMPEEKEYYSPNIGVRCFTKNFPSLPQHVVKNTKIMRMMDVNLSHGSHYINTKNYPNFESDVQKAIKEVMECYEINQEDVVMYGELKGGTGALYHALLGDYKCVCVAPIINQKEYNQLINDEHFFKQAPIEDITSKLEQLMKKCHRKKIIISSSYIPLDHGFYSQSTNEKIIDIVPIVDLAIKEHKDVVIHSVSEQVTLINELLLASKNLEKMTKDLYQIILDNYLHFE